MIGVLNDAGRSIIGVFRLMAFREDWRSYFNISPQGVARSFGAMVLALPSFVFTYFAINYLVGTNAANVSPEAYMRLDEALLTYARYWLLFPPIAFAITFAMSLTGRLAAWLVVQNWTVFILTHIQAMIFACYAAGLADAGAVGGLIALFILARWLAFWRVAAGALEASPALAAGLVAMPIAFDYVARDLI